MQSAPLFIAAAIAEPSVPAVTAMPAEIIASNKAYSAADAPASSRQKEARKQSDLVITEFPNTLYCADGTSPSLMLLLDAPLPPSNPSQEKVAPAVAGASIQVGLMSTYAQIAKKDLSNGLL